MDTKMRSVLCLLVTCCIALAGCSLPAQERDVEDGRLDILLTDAPPDLNVEKALITISKVEVHATGKAKDSGKGKKAGWLTVVDALQTYDLIALQDAEAFLGAANVKAGKYTQIRLHIDAAVATIDGTEHELRVPSGAITVVHSFAVAEGRTTKLTLDLDAQASIHAAGKKYVLRPTIKVIVDGPASGS